MNILRLLTQRTDIAFFLKHLEKYSITGLMKKFRAVRCRKLTFPRKKKLCSVLHRLFVSLSSSSVPADVGTCSQIVRVRQQRESHHLGCHWATQCSLHHYHSFTVHCIIKQEIKCFLCFCLGNDLVFKYFGIFTFISVCLTHSSIQTFQLLEFLVLT